MNLQRAPQTFDYRKKLVNLQRAPQTFDYIKKLVNRQNFFFFLVDALFETAGSQEGDLPFVVPNEALLLK